MLRSLMSAACLALLTGVAPLSVAQEPAPAATETLFQRVVPNEQLASLRGGAQQVNLMDLDAALHHNSARATMSGDNTVSSGAFANSSGVVNVVQNSGNNVIIQNATILNLDLK